MELEKQLEKIEELRTDKHMQLLLLGIKSLGALSWKSDIVITRHLSKKNKTINNKLYQFSYDLLDDFGNNVYEFTEPASEEIGMFCGMGDYGIDGFLIFEYSIGAISLDELIETLKESAVDISNIPEAEFDAVFGNCDED